LRADGEAMPEDDITRLLQEIAAATSVDELAAIASGIEEDNFDEQSLERLTDALREARERLCGK